MSLMISEWTGAMAQQDTPVLQAMARPMGMCTPSWSGMMAMGRLLCLDAVSHRMRPIFLPLDEPWVELRDC